MLNVDCDKKFSTFSPAMLGQTAPEYGSFSSGNVLEDRTFDATENPIFHQGFLL